MFHRFIAIALAALALNAFAAVEANRANQAELETVKGIGPGLSAKILKARESGEFKGWADLVERVSGVGPGNAARFSQAGLTVAGAPYDTGATTTPAKRERKMARTDATGTDKMVRKAATAKAAP